MRYIHNVLAIGISAVIFVVGCSVEDERDPDEDLSTAPGDVTSEPTEVVVAPGEQDVIAPAAGCSVVQFCNAPGGDGTRCLQQGCVTGTAIVECGEEVRSICGEPTCPWVFVGLTGTRFQILCP